MAQQKTEQPKQFIAKQSQAGLISSPLSQEALYAELINSIPNDERPDVVAELDSWRITQRANKLKEELAKGEVEGLYSSESRNTLLAANRNVRDKQMSMAQLATLHILDVAVRSIYINPMVFLINKFVDPRGEIQTRTLGYPVSSDQVQTFTMNSVKRCLYNQIIVPKEGMLIADLPLRMQKPLVQRYFNLNESEWTEFCKEMKQSPQSEQYCHILVAPSAGCLSGLVVKLQELLKCMRVLDWFANYNQGLLVEKIMLVPSFTMFQAAVNAKAHGLKRQSLELVPTYGYMESERYLALKSLGKLAFALYLPERSNISYQPNVGRFRTTIDGFAMETALTGALHAMYHAMRELSLSEGVAKARFRMAAIAKQHPKNKKTPTSRPIDDILVDGELIFSYPLAMDTMFDPDVRSESADIFGKIFYEHGMKGKLDDDLKRAFIEDMVVEAKMWQDEFGIGKADLLPQDQVIYEQIKKAAVSTDDSKTAQGPTMAPAPVASAAPASFATAKTTTPSTIRFFGGAAIAAPAPSDSSKIEFPRESDQDKISRRKMIVAAYFSAHLVEVENKKGAYAIKNIDTILKDLLYDRVFYWERDSINAEINNMALANSGAEQFITADQLSKIIDKIAETKILLSSVAIQHYKQSTQTAAAPAFNSAAAADEGNADFKQAGPG